MAKRFKGAYDPLKLTNVSIRQMRVFMKYIAKHNLWKELEASLRENGIRNLHMSVHPIYAIQDEIEKSLKKGDKSGKLIVESEH